MLQQFQPQKRFHLPSFSSRLARYLIVAFVFIVVIVLSLLLQSGWNHSPIHQIDREENHTHGQRFGIQSAFEKESAAANTTRLDRQQQIRTAFIHAWEGYKSHAWLHDEVMPLLGGSRDPFVGWAATLIDSLDSLYIIGLQGEFESALKALEAIDFSKPNAERVPVFETTIRYLGGFLGAYDVSGGQYPILLEKADQLDEFLFQAFNTESGVCIPDPYYHWQKLNKKPKGEDGVIIAQIGSLSLGFTRLAQLTGKRKYFDGIIRITNHLDKAQNHTRIPGLWPSPIDTAGPSFDGSAFTLGAWADSLYEYLPKEHKLLGDKTIQYLRMYLTALQSAEKYYFFRPKTPNNQDILFPGSLNGVSLAGFFVGGMVGLGARINNSPSELATAIKLTNGCVWAYQNTASGIMPEIFFVEECPTEGSCDWNNQNAVEPGHQHGFTKLADTSYQLRPEAIESVFLMYRINGDAVWREKGWDMFLAIRNHTTTPIANARLSDVTKPSPPQEDSMESFWLAETLKYFFLLFSEPSVISLDDFVLNTEAHPFRQRRTLYEI